MEMKARALTNMFQIASWDFQLFLTWEDILYSLYKQSFCGGGGGGGGILFCFGLMIAYMVLFFTLEQTHCARMWFYMSD